MSPRDRGAEPVPRYDALGNRFWLVPGALPAAPDARALCAGGAADGVLALEGDRVMLRNADGSAAGFSGNGLRCAALHRCLTAGAPARATLEMGGSAYAVEVLGEGERREVRVTAEAPARRLEPAPSGTLPADPALEGLDPWLVDVGNPHLVLLAGADATAPPAPLLETLRGGVPPWPEGVNVTWLRVDAEASATARTHERGVGPTPACASGTLAAFLAARAAGRIGDRARVRLPGGELDLRVLDDQGPLVRFSSPVRRCPAEPGAGERGDVPGRR